MESKLINWKEWDDAECQQAWGKLSSQYSTIELMYAFYGAMLKGDLTFTGSLQGLNTHYQNAPHIDFECVQADVVQEDVISFFQDIDVSDLADVAASFVLTDEQKESGLDKVVNLNRALCQFTLGCAPLDHPED